MDQLTDLIRDYGGYAGLASVLGLAVLSLLYFAQAREVRRLREWAGRAPERAAEVEQRIAGDVRRPSAVTARPIAPQTAAGQASQGAPAAARPATATAGAATAATAVTPAPGAGTAPATAAGNGQGGAPAPPAPETAKPAGATPPAEAGDTTPPALPAAAPPAAPAAKPGTPPSPSPSPAVPGTPAPRTAAARPAGAPAVRPPVPRPAARPAAAPLRSGAPSRTLPPGTTVRGSGDGSGRGRSIGKILAVIAGVVVLAIVAVVLVTGGGGSDQPASTTNEVTPPAGQSQTTAQSPSEITVGVLNGTSINGLARTTAEKLRTAGYTVPDDLIADAVERNRSATVVYFKEGSRTAARQIADAIGAGPDAIAAMDQDTLTLAGDRAPVVVTVGADQNTQSG